MNRKMKIGFMIWVAFCTLVVLFAIIYIIRGQVEANSQTLALLQITTKTPQIIRGL